MLLFVMCASLVVVAEPQGTQIVSNVTETAPVDAAGSLTTAGGSFTTLILNTTTQTPHWKAYVGNVTGLFTLDDADGNTIYDWTASTFTGEVYASRSNSVNWANVDCVQDATITTEHSALNMTSLQPDNINRTFNNTIHAEFWVSSNYIAQSTCRAIATYINDSAQTPDVNADFQVVLLDDTTSMIFAALVEDDVSGFDNAPYDFQMIVPESDVAISPHTYYFYTELG